MTSFSRILGQSPQLPGPRRTRAWHHHGSHMPTFYGDILLGEMAYHTKQIRRQCILPKCIHYSLNRIKIDTALCDMSAVEFKAARKMRL